MKLPCWLAGHTWGPWSKPMKMTVWYYDIWTGKKVGEPYTAWEQHRTCDRCGVQQERIPEEV